MARTEEVESVSSENFELPFQKSFRKVIRHPPCVRYLLRHGAPSDMRHDKVISVLSRYVVAKGLTDLQGKKMARAVIDHDISLLSGKDSALQKFAESLSAVRHNPEANYWSCGDIWSSKKLRDGGACAGWNCEYYHLWERAESNRQNQETQAKMEEETISYLLNNPQKADEALRLGSRSEGFFCEYECRDGTSLPLNRVLWHICRHLADHGRPVHYSAILTLLSRSAEMRPYVGEIERHVEQMRKRPPCRHSQFLEHLNVIEECGARLRGEELIRRAGIALTSHALPFEIVVRTLAFQSSALLSTGHRKSHLSKYDLDDFVTNFYSKRYDVMPTPSEWLSACLGGGWELNRLYAVNASCAAEATDFSAWCAEFAAQRRFITLWVSYAMNNEDLTERAVARYCGLDAKELSRYRQNALDSQADSSILERIAEAGEGLSRRITPHVVLAEANLGLTLADLKRSARTALQGVGAIDDRPALIILDQLPIPCSRRPAFREETIFTDLGREMRDLPVALLAVFSRDEGISGAAFEENEPAKEQLPDLLGKFTAADYILTLQSKHAKVRGTASEKNVDQLSLSREWYKRHSPRSRDDVDRLFDEAVGAYSLDETTSSYVRISLLDKEGRARANPVIVYERPFHRFRTLNVEPSALEKLDF